MKIIALFILILLGIGNLFCQQSVEYISVNGSQRSYIQYLPSNYSPSTEELPVVFVLHGLDGSAQQMTTSGFNAIADTARFIPIYPQGTLNGFGQASWNNGTMLGSSTDDVHFLDTLIQVLNDDYNTDLSRIYICGLSAGGAMSYRMALKKPEKIAAMASMAGTMSTEDYNNFSSTVLNMPVMHWHGTYDQVVPYDSNPVASITLVPGTLDFWKLKNSCSLIDSTIITIPDSANDGITVDRVVYEDCYIDDELELWIFNGGEHAWFSEPYNDADGALEFWKFFSRFENTNDNLSIPESTPAVDIFPNPSHNFITIKYQGTIDDIQITDLKGKRLKNFHFSNGVVDVSNLSQGWYYMQIVTPKHSLVKKFTITR